jgi:hypothetical protein
MDLPIIRNQKITDDYWIKTTIKQTIMKGNKAVARKTTTHYSKTGTTVTTTRTIRKKLSPQCRIT